MLPHAHIIHQIKGRIRLRIPDMRGDSAYFEQVGNKISALECLSQYNTNTITGCIVMHHPENDWSDVSEQLDALDLFEITEALIEDTPAMMPLLHGVSRLDKAVAQGSAGRLDLRTITYIALLVLAIRQIMQGQVLGPAMPLLLHAWTLADKFGTDLQGDAGE